MVSSLRVLGILSARTQNHLWKEQVRYAPGAKATLWSADPEKDGCSLVASTTLNATLCHGAGRCQVRNVQCAGVSSWKQEAGLKDTVAETQTAATLRKAKNILNIVDAALAEVLI